MRSYWAPGLQHPGRMFRWGSASALVIVMIITPIIGPVINTTPIGRSTRNTCRRQSFIANRLSSRVRCVVSRSFGNGRPGVNTLRIARLKCARSTGLMP